MSYYGMVPCVRTLAEVLGFEIWLTKLVKVHLQWPSKRFFLQPYSQMDMLIVQSTKIVPDP